MRVLRECRPLEANRLEVQIMHAYRKRGEATMNRTLKAFGRPLADPEMVADCQMQFRVTPAKKDAYKRAAAAEGLTLTAWIIREADREAGYVPKAPKPTAEAPA